MRRVALLAVVLVGLVAPAGGAGPAAATPEPPPNVVFVLTDDQSMEALSIGLPFLDAEPGGHWVRFENAFVNTALCCPSRATILSGRYSHNHGVVDNEAGARLDDTSTVATWLDDAGYRTGLVGKYLNAYPFPFRGPVVPPGWDSWVAFRNGIGYVDFDVAQGGDVVTSHPQGYSTDVLTSWAVRFLEEPSPDPFFLYLAYNAPHEPNLPAPRHERTFRDLAIAELPSFNEADVADKPRWVRDIPLLTREDARRLEKQRRHEYESLLAVDEGIQAVYDTLDDNGVLDDTVIVFMTDNGYSFGEHRHVRKTCAYEECVRTPLLIRYPDGPAGSRTVDELVSNVDLAPTFAELAGATPTTPVDGSSLVPFLDGESPAWRDALLLEWRSIRERKMPRYWAVRTETHKWVEYDTGERELYDLVADPYELQNLAGTDPDLEAELHDRLVDVRGF